MAVSITCTGTDQSSGRLYVRWNDGTELEFRNVQEARDYVRDAYEDAAAVREMLKRMGIAKMITAVNGGAQPSAFAGKSITLDLSLAANIVRVT